MPQVKAGQETTLEQDQEKKEKPKGVAVIDTSFEKTIDHQAKDGIVEIKFSHMSSICTIIESENSTIIEVYPAGARIKERPELFNAVKVNKAFQNILDTHEETGVGAVNFSSLLSLEIEGCNTLISQLAPEKSKNIKITKDNILENAELIKTVITKHVNLGPKQNTQVLKIMLERADIVNKLSAKGVVVIQCAGNNGPKNFNLLSVLAPDVISVGGLGGWFNKTPHKYSANNSAIDAWAPYSHAIPVKGEETRLREFGTSVSAPMLVDDVLKLQSEGNSPAEINKILRQKFAFKK